MGEGCHLKNEDQIMTNRIKFFSQNMCRFWSEYCWKSTRTCHACIIEQQIFCNWFLAWIIIVEPTCKEKWLTILLTFVSVEDNINIIQGMGCLNLNYIMTTCHLVVCLKIRALPKMLWLIKYAPFISEMDFYFSIIKVKSMMVWATKLQTGK